MPAAVRRCTYTDEVTRDLALLSARNSTQRYRTGKKIAMPECHTLDLQNRGCTARMPFPCCKPFGWWFTRTLGGESSNLRPNPDMLSVPLSNRPQIAKSDMP